jgi:hypothetical protein
MDRAAFLVLALVGCGGVESRAPAADSGHPDARETGADADLVLQGEDAGADSAVGPSIGCNGVEVTTVSPNPICNGTLTIEGKNFQPTPAVLISCDNAQKNPIALTNVTFISSTKLTATLPMGTNMWGHCDMTVVNPDSCSSTLPDAFWFWCEGPGH